MKVNCECCGIEFNKFPKEVKGTNANYCSRSCAAKINNKKFPKLTAKKHFCGCGNERKRKDVQTCKACIKKRLEECSDLTIGERTYHKHKSAKYSYIRADAKRILKNFTDKSCKNCGYNKHTEVAHIKSIASFPKDTKIKEVNDINNLIFLCPNCHWEFDHGDLTLENIKNSGQ